MALTARTTIRVALVEDSKIFAREMRALFDQSEGISCVAICPTVAAAREQLVALAPDVILVDLRLPDGNGAELLGELYSEMPETDFVVLTIFDDSESIETAIRNGAAGYLLKGSGGDQIIQAVRDVHEGRSPLDRNISRRVLALLRELPRLREKLAELTEQENTLLRELSRGASVKEAAATLGVTYASARTYVRRMYAKLGVHSRAEAARRLLHFGSSSPSATRAGP